MENFIEDLLSVLIEEAEETKTNAIDDFEKGKLFGYYHSISTILSQSVAFNVYDKLPERLQEYIPENLLR